MLYINLSRYACKCQMVAVEIVGYFFVLVDISFQSLPRVVFPNRQNNLCQRLKVVRRRKINDTFLTFIERIITCIFCFQLF